MQQTTKEYKPIQFGQFNRDTLNPHAYEGHMVIGEKGAGKSALGEAMAIEMHKRGIVVFDAIDANDFESLFYGIPRKPLGKYYPVLLIHPPTFDVKIPDGWSHYRPMCSAQGLLKILQTARAEKRIISMACGLWPMGSVGKVLADWFFEFPDVQRKFKTHVFLFMREIGNYAFSQLRVFKDTEERFRQATIYLMRVGRHNRITFFFDLQRAVDLYKGIRTLCDHIHIKKSGRSMIPPELGWVLTALEENRDKFEYQDWKLRHLMFPKIGKMQKNQYYSIGRSEVLDPAYRFKMAPFRHKDPKEDFEELTGIQFIRNKVSEDQLEDSTVTDLQRAIYKAKIKDPELSYRQIAKAVDCSHSYVHDTLDF